MNKDLLTEKFAGIYAENKELMFQLAYNILHNHADADDAMSQAVLKAWENVGLLRDEGALRSWLLRIVINASKDMCKKQKNECLTQDTEVFEREMVRETDYNVWELVEQLDEKYSTVLILYYYRDMSVNEISQILQIPESTVKIRLSRGREYLKKQCQGR